MNKYKQIRIDVGCAATAPNSALWILDNPKVEVHAFEPDLRSFRILKYGKSTNQYPDKLRIIKKKKIISFKKKVLKKIQDKNFKIYNCGIDNVSFPTKKFFYHVGKENYGCSSLIKPISEKLGIKTDYRKLVKIYPLSFFLKKFKGKYVEMLKSDTQGNDLNVLKSSGNLIKKIIFIQSEYWANQDYEGEKSKIESRREIIKFMSKKNFYCYFYTDTDIFFVNTGLKKIINKYKISDSCLDFPKGLYEKSMWFSVYDGKLRAYCLIRDFLKSILPKRILNFIKYFF